MSNVAKPDLISIERCSPKAKTPRSRGPFTRKYDSGICLGNDETKGKNNPRLDGSECKSVDAIDNHESFGGNDNFEDNQNASSQGSEEDRFNSIFQKAMQGTKDPGDVMGPVFPCWQMQPENL